METEKLPEKKEKKGSFFSLRKSFSGRGSSAGLDQDNVTADGESVTSAQDYASPLSDKSFSGRRASAPSNLMVVDENLSDMGSEFGGSGQPKKSKMFSTKFVKKMFKSNKGSEGVASSDGFSIADDDEAIDDRMSEASGATGTVDESGVPKKKKKMFSTKFVKKIFRSNSMSSAGGGDTSFANEEVASIAGESEASPTQARRKSIFSFGKSPKTDAKSVDKAIVSDSKPVTIDPYQGPISPTFMARKPFRNELADLETEEEPNSKLPASEADTTPFKAENVAPVSPKSESLSPSSEIVLTPLTTKVSGSAWKLFDAVEEGVPAAPEEVQDPSVSPGRLEYDLPLHNAAEADQHIEASEVDADAEPFVLLERASPSLADSEQEHFDDHEVSKEDNVVVSKIKVSFAIQLIKIINFIFIGCRARRIPRKSRCLS